MQIDKALIKSFKQGDTPIFRLYLWERSFSVGLSQSCQDYPLHVKEYGGNCAKRVTGGGVLFHGADISYSLVMEDENFKSLSVKQSYEKICQFLLDFYKNLGLKPDFAKDISSIKMSKNSLCQMGYEAYDIIINGKKIGGNAQKRAKNIIFQHGSIPIKATKEKTKEGYSLQDFGVYMSFDEAREGLIASFEKSFGVKLAPSQLNDKEEMMLSSILEEDYDN